MLASITPLGERGRNMWWPRTIAFYLAGSLLGGAALGALAGTAGWVMRQLSEPGRSLTLSAVAFLSLAAMVLDSGWARLRLPTIHRQVSEEWLGRYRGWVYGLTFGAQLGLGFVTTASTAAVYLVAALAVLSGSFVSAVLIGSTFGLARGLPVLLAARVTSPERLGRLHQRLASWRERMQAVTVASEMLVGAAAVATLAGLR